MQPKVRFSSSRLAQAGRSLPAELNRLGLLAFPPLFAALEPPPADSLRGVFRGAFVGPGWLRWLAGPLLAVTGLGGWWGKDFDEQGNAVNLVMRQGQLQRRYPMLLGEDISRPRPAARAEPALRPGKSLALALDRG